MADVELGELRDGSDRDDIVIGQAMAGVRLDPVLPRQRGGVGEAAEFGGAFLALHMRIAAGVEFDDGRLQPHRRLDLARVGFDEQADANARVGQARHDRGKMVVLAGGVEPALGRALLALFGDDAGGVRRMAQRNRQHLVGRRHFEVERQVGRGLDAGEVVIADVAAVFAQMRGDAVSADRRDNLGRADRIRMIAAARVADRRDMVDVDAQAQPPRGGRAQFARLPGFIAGVAASSGGSSSSA